jgi:hypothetical protein
MTPYKLDVIHLDELREATISCPDCNTRITVRLDQQRPAPRACPSCAKKFDAHLDAILASLYEARSSVERTDFSVEFHIRQEIEQKAAT